VYGDTQKRQLFGTTLSKTELSRRFLGQLSGQSCPNNFHLGQLCKMADILKIRIKELSVRRRTLEKSALDRVQAQEIKESLILVA